MNDFDRALAEYYDLEARRGLRADLGELRHNLRESFAQLLLREDRRTVIDVGAGPGRDTVEFAAAGFEAAALELATENVRQLEAAGVAGVVASLFDPPFQPRSFDAVWTMSTLVHVPDDRLDDALEAITSLAKPGAPVGIGTWGGFDWEGMSEVPASMPPRFFSLRTHDRFRAAVSQHGAVDRFETFHPDVSIHWQYQFVVVRCG